MARRTGGDRRRVARGRQLHADELRLLPLAAVGVGRRLLEPHVIGPRVAYVVAEYPKVSHTFVMREVDALRALGVSVETVTIRPTPESGLYSEADRRAAAETFAVL